LIGRATLCQPGHTEPAFSFFGEYRKEKKKRVPAKITGISMGEGKIARSAQSALLNIDKPGHDIPDKTGRDTEVRALLQYSMQPAAKKLSEKECADHERKRGELKTQTRYDPQHDHNRNGDMDREKPLARESLCIGTPVAERQVY
jgi:hypothetical protein